MQYLLTEAEYGALTARANEGTALKHLYPSKEELQAFCTLVADNMPVQSGWYAGKVWGCIVSRKDDGSNIDWYCDDCPARKFCPYEWKQFSQ